MIPRSFGRQTDETEFRARSGPGVGPDGSSALHKGESENISTTILSDTNPSPVRSQPWLRGTFSLNKNVGLFNSKFMDTNNPIFGAVEWIDVEVLRTVPSHGS